MNKLIYELSHELLQIRESFFVSAFSCEAEHGQRVTEGDAEGSGKGRRGAEGDGGTEGNGGLEEQGDGGESGGGPRVSRRGR